MAFSARSIPRTKRAPQLLADSAPMRCALDRLAKSMASPSTVPRPEFRQSLRSLLVAEASVMALHRPPRRPPKVRRSKGGFRLAALGIGISAAGGGIALAANQVTTTPPVPTATPPVTAPDPHQATSPSTVTSDRPPPTETPSPAVGLRTVGGAALALPPSAPASRPPAAPPAVPDALHAPPSPPVPPSVSPSAVSTPSITSVSPTPSSGTSSPGRQGRWSPAPLLPTASIQTGSNTDQGGLGSNAFEVP